MKVYNQGVLEESEVYFHTHSFQASQMFFYPMCVGHYMCDKTYHVQRQRYNSFLIMYVVRGEGYIEEEGGKKPLKADSFAFLDCYQPHGYGTDKGWEIYWLHFDGIMARRYYAACTEGSRILTPASSYAGARSLRKIFETYSTSHKVNEAVLSRRITDLLTELLCARSEMDSEGHSGMVEETLAFISENANQPLTLQDMADHASLSPYHFSRIFKRETGFTPHEYLVYTRVNMAKYMLRGGVHTVKSIAFQCGFNSECSFCTTFKRVTGKTPAEYRRQTLS